MNEIIEYRYDDTKGYLDAEWQLFLKGLSEIEKQYPNIFKEEKLLVLIAIAFKEDGKYIQINPPLPEEYPKELKDAIFALFTRIFIGKQSS